MARQWRVWAEAGCARRRRFGELGGAREGQSLLSGEMEAAVQKDDAAAVDAGSRAGRPPTPPRPGRTALHLAAESGVRRLPWCWCEEAAIWRWGRGRTHAAAAGRPREAEALVGALLEQKAGVQAVDTNQQTALHLTVRFRPSLGSHCCCCRCLAGKFPSISCLSLCC